MSTQNITKINQLLTSQPMGVVLQAFWLADHGYSPDLQKRYRAGNWLQSIGTGAMIRTGDHVSYEGAIYALQNQSNFTIHPAGRTALSFLGKTHYLELAASKATLFGAKGERLPKWVLNYDWGVTLDYHQSSFLPPDLDMVEVELKNFTIKVSGAARALMECLYLAPERQELYECLELMQGLNNLRPERVQQLLEQCQSIKVKRLFLYLAEKAEHQWFQYLNKKKIDLGEGKRSIVKHGVYVDAYRITVPKELEEYGKSNI